MHNLRLQLIISEVLQLGIKKIFVLLVQGVLLLESLFDSVGHFGELAGFVGAENIFVLEIVV